MQAELKSRLAEVASRQRRVRLWFKLAACWCVAASLALLLVWLQNSRGLTFAFSLPGLCLLSLGAVLWCVLRGSTAPPNVRGLAVEIERRFPLLQGRLLTAVEQQPPPGGQLNFLQERLLDEVLRHARQSDWGEIVPRGRMRLAQWSHWLALVAFASALPLLRTDRARPGFAQRPNGGVTVSPGDTSLERGSSLVVLARFTGPLPADVELVVGEGATAHRTPLAKSLSDPMFGGSVPEVASNFVYHVEYSGKHTRDFKVQVFEYPRLERADADITFPEYTGEAPKHIPNTRRVSAVEGSRLGLTLTLNKPVVSARFISKDKQRQVVNLTFETNRPAAALTDFTLASSKTFDLQLIDAEGRTNKVGAQFVLAALTNATPELRLASPRGDLRPSSLEEIAFEGTTWDDFGVQAYGLGYALAGQEPQFIQLGDHIPAREKRTFHYMLRLEDLKAQPDDLISWFVWADDLGPDGKLRRTTGDLYFADVRSFDEIFRQGQGMDGQSAQQQSGQQGNRSARLAELQKQIILATWKLQRSQSKAASPQRSEPALPPESRNEARPRLPAQEVQLLRISSRVFAQRSPGARPDPTAPDSSGDSRPSRPAVKDDPGVVLDSQADALEQAKAILERQRDPRTAMLWSAAVKDMERALTRLQAATNSPADFADALAAERAAYQALLKVQEHEYQVMRSRSQNQRGGGQSQQMQRQLEQMDLKDPENRYETERQATPPQTAQRREQLQVQNRLQELARRQNDLNERLKELQTALQEARTEEERADIQRRLKRLQEEEQQMLSDVDELRQRMDRPENQSTMNKERQQLDKTRQDVQQAADSAGQGAVSQALASGTRAQRQFQQMRDQMRKENSSQFADDLRQMRAQSRELTRQQDELLQKMSAQADSGPRKLSDSTDHEGLLKDLASQKARLTNLVDRATEISQQAEEAEPLLSKQLYDTVRKFSQDSAKSASELQSELLRNGRMTRSLYDQFNSASTPDAAKLLEAASEMVRQDELPQASQAGQRSRAGMETLQRGVERAAESVIGDDAEALRLAEQQLNRLTDQLQQEIRQGEGGASSTNGLRAAGPGAAGTNELARAEAAGQQSRRPAGARGGRQGDQNGPPGSRQADQANSQSSPGQRPDGQTPGTERPQESAQGQQASTQDGQQGGGQAGAAANAQANARDGDQPTSGERNPGNNRSGWRVGQPGGGDRFNSGAGGGEGGGANGGWNWDQFLTENGPRLGGPLTGDDFVQWSDGLREIEEVLEDPQLRNQVATARERARVLRQQSRQQRQKPDWAVVRLQVMKPLAEVRDRIADELARRESREALVPIDRDPVPSRYSELVRRYYEELGKEK